MARFKKRQRRKTKASEQVLYIEELGWHGDGIAETDGKRVFVPFTLAGETVRAMVSGNRAQLIEVLEPSSERIEAPCPHFGHCGGCAVQHLAPNSYDNWFALKNSRSIDK